MELKKHTPEEFELMSGEEFNEYEDKLIGLAEEIGLKRNTLEELEESLLNIKELAKKKKHGHTYWQCTKKETKCLNNISSATEKFRKTFIKEITGLIGSGMLVLSKAIRYKSPYDDTYTIKYIYSERVYDLYDECEYTNVISCSEKPGCEESIELHMLPIDVLLRIYDNITNGNALLMTDEEVIASNIDSEAIRI